MNKKTVIATALCVAVCAVIAVHAAPKTAQSARAHIPFQSDNKQDPAVQLLARADDLYQQQRYAEAVELYRQGAEQYPSLPLFDMRLGEMYFFGEGVEKDAEQAHKRLYEAHSNIFNYGDPYRIEQQNEILDNLRYLLGKAGVETGNFLPAGIGIKAYIAISGHQAAYNELPDDLRAMYAEHIRPPDPDGKTQWHDANLKFAQERMGTVFNEDGRKLSSWNTVMHSIGLDNSFLLGIAYEHGIGVPKNRIAAQALRLYAREMWRQHRDKRREGHFWLLNDLSAAEQAEAENLAQRLLTLSAEEPRASRHSAVLDKVRKFAGQAPQ